MRNTRSRLYAFLGALAVLISLGALSGCTGLMGESGNGEAVPQKMYIDATRNFAVEFPGDWIRYTDSDTPLFRAADSLGWKSPEEKENAPVARMLIVIPQEPMEKDTVESQIKKNTPDLSITESEEIEISDLSGVGLLGHTPRRKFRIVMLGEPIVSYILIYSALPDYYDRHLSRFEEMVSSFETLQ